MDMTKVRRFNELCKRKSALAEELKQVEAEIDVAEEDVIGEMTNDGVDKVSADGRTVYLKRSFFAKASGPSAVKALEDEGLGDCVMVGAQKLRGLVSEHLKGYFEKHETDPLEVAMEVFYQQYPKLKGIVFAGEKWGLGHRGS